MRWGISSIVLVTVLVVRERGLPRMPDRSAVWKILLLALVGMVFQQWLYMLGLKRTTGTSAAVLQLITPPVATFFSLALRIERAMWEKVVGVILAVSGTAVFMGVQNMDLSEGVVGNLLICTSSSTSAFYLLWGRPLWASVGASTVSAWCFTITYELAR